MIGNGEVFPAFIGNNVAIACSSSKEYVPYLSVYLSSIIEHTSPERKYDIFVFERGIDTENKRKLLNFVQKDNVSLRFIDPSYLFENRKLYVSLPYFKEECYYRIASPIVLNRFDKIIFTDIDLIMKQDILDCALIDLNGKVIAACKEPMMQEMYEDNYVENNIQIRKYLDDILRIEPNEYFNTGVCVIDVNKYNRIEAFNEISSLMQKYNFLYQEQDALNVYFKDNFFELSPLWNGEVSPSILNVKKEYHRQYKDNFNSSHIFHWLGSIKPWLYPTKEYGEIWWQYARKSPFYEEILARLIDFRIHQLKDGVMHQFKQKFAKSETDTANICHELANVHFPNINKHFAVDEYQTKMLFVLNHLGRFKAKKAYFAVKKAFAFGEKHKKYQQKYDVVKQLIRDAKTFKKRLLEI